jgi:hypothetical protein
MLLSDAAMDSVISGRSLKQTLTDLWDRPVSATEFLEDVCEQMSVFRSNQEAMIISDAMDAEPAKDFRKRANNVCNEIGRQVRGLTGGEFTIKCVSRKDGHKYEAVTPTPRPATASVKSEEPDTTDRTYSATEVIQYHNNELANNPLTVLTSLVNVHGDDKFKELLKELVVSRLDKD